MAVHKKGPGDRDPPLERRTLIALTNPKVARDTATTLSIFSAKNEPELRLE